MTQRIRITTLRFKEKYSIYSGATFPAKILEDGYAEIQDPFTMDILKLHPSDYYSIHQKKNTHEDENEIKTIYMFNSILFNSLTEANEYKSIYKILDNFGICIDRLSDDDKKEMTQQLKQVFTEEPS